MLAPNAKLGVVVLTNRNPSFLTEAVARTVVDRFLALPDKDWNDYYVKLDKKQRAEKAKKEAGIKAKRMPNTQPSRDLTAFAGTYDHPAYGRAPSLATKDALTIQWSSFKLPLQHWHYDTFRTFAPGEYVLENEFLVFNFEADAGVRSFRWLGQEFMRQKGKKGGS